MALATRDREVHHHIAFLARTEADGTIDIDEARAGDPLYAFVEIDGRFVQFYAGIPSDGFHDLGGIRVGLGRTVAGTVLGADGLRIGAAMVMLQPVIAWENAAPPGNTNLPRVLTRVTYTDRAGRFRFDHVPRTQHRCLIAAGFAGMRLVPLAADGDVGTVQMDARTAVRGIACLPDGTRASAASLQYAVSLDGDGATFGTTYLVGRTGARGEFAFQGLPPPGVGSGWVMAARDGAGFITTFAAGAPGGEATVRLAPHPGRF